MQTNVEVTNGVVSGTLKFIEGGLSPAGPLAGDGYFLALHWSDPDTNATSLKVGLKPSESGMEPVECISDTDRNGVFKINDPKVQQLRFVQSDNAGHRNIQIFNLSGLEFEPEGA